MDGDFVAVAAGDWHSLALRRDGSVACWGRNHRSQAPPAGVDGDFVAIAAGERHSLALRHDGTIAYWGWNGTNDTNQAPPAGGFVAIAAGSIHSLALRRDGTVACWGRNVYGEAPTPEHDEEYGEDEYATLSAKFPFMTDVHILL